MYKYDNEGKVVYSYVYDSETYTNLNGTRVVYDDQSRVFSIFHSFDYRTSSGVADDTTHYNYNYNAETGNLAKLKADGAYFSGEMIPTYDKFGRTENKTIDFSVNGSKAFYNKLIYDYVTNADSESVLVSQLISQVGKTSGSTTSTTYNYTYDNNGNITQITNASGVIQNKYYYDALGQLVREDNRALNSTYTYSYDNAGNITSKKRYAFTTGTLGSVLNTFSYTYGDSTWKDLLTNYNGTSISYDTIGNPTTIGYAELTWQGRELTSYNDNESYELSFGYNADGIRTYKKVYDNLIGETFIHEYILNGTQIICEAVYYVGDDLELEERYRIVYLYDETGAPVGMKYREPSYAAGVYDCFFFEKNLQGDIIAVYNSSGTKLITYDYDAWGKCTTTYVAGYSACGGAVYNPFRYRGYYYDVETGWYYLQSRYYNPEWGRFLNADGYIGTGGFAGYNLFTYCRNNPVRYCDYSGMCSHIMGVPGVACKYCDPDEWAGIESSDAIATPPKTQEFEANEAEGLDWWHSTKKIICFQQFGIDVFSEYAQSSTIPLGKYSDDFIRKLNHTSDFLGDASMFIDVLLTTSEILYNVNQNVNRGVAWDKTAYDAGVDLFFGGTFAITGYYATAYAMGATAGGLPGVLAVASVGVAMSGIEWLLVDVFGLKDLVKGLCE